ncbi:MAG: bifunctional folylpolyglutamate synthase/dihydrofolate synthase [Candidatus Aminicenantes bacterium]|nr:bifunctional folylpolyglutamate synthase/dihydrofolate synthase [Candidatus Aminicenantes bacterium]
MTSHKTAGLASKDCREYLEHLTLHGIKLGLDNIRTLLADLDDPQTGFPVVHVAGTNGKGSVSAMLASVLARHGYRVGLYTSPHLVRVEERIRVGDRLIGSADFCRLLSVLRRRIEKLLKAGRLTAHPTYFEVLTAVAFLYFRERPVDIAIFEVGMGGRFDATNVVTPILSVITSISRDHEEYLGKGIARIAGEKAGIIKPGVPVVCGVEAGLARAVIERRAKALRAPFRPVFGARNGFRAARSDAGYRFLYDSGRHVYLFRPGLRGRHQGWNAAVAAAAAEVVSDVWRPLAPGRIIVGLEKARWPGRLELVSRRPDVLLDGCHNEEGAKALARYIEESVPGAPFLVFAASADKPVRKMARLLFSPARRVVLTRFPSPRALDPARLRNLLPAFKAKMDVEPEPGTAVRRAVRAAGPKGTVIVAGSLFLVGEVKRLRLFSPR